MDLKSSNLKFTTLEIIVRFSSFSPWFKFVNQQKSSLSFRLLCIEFLVKIIYLLLLYIYCHKLLCPIIFFKSKKLN